MITFLYYFSPVTNTDGKFTVGVWASISGIIQNWKIYSNYPRDLQSIPLSFSINDTISISANVSDSNNNTYTNLKYICTEDEWFRPSTGARVIPYRDEKIVTFHSYYPWEDLNDMIDSRIMVNLSNQSNFTDVLKSDSTGSVYFTFEHILSKLRLNFSSVVHCVIITNQPSVYFNPNITIDDENAIVKANEGNITMKNENGNFTAYLAPFKNEKNSLLLINSAKKNFSIAFQDIIPELKRGCFYDYYIDLQKYISNPNPKQLHNIALKLLRVMLLLLKSK